MKYACLLLAVPALAFAQSGDISQIDLKVGSTDTRAVANGHQSDKVKGTSIAIEGNRLFEDSTAFDALKLGIFGGLSYDELNDKKAPSGTKFTIHNLNLNAGGVMNLELGSRVNLYAKAGVIYSITDAKRTIGMEAESASANGFGYTLGGGANVRVTDHLTFGAEYRLNRPYYEEKNGFEYSLRGSSVFLTAGYQF